MPYGDKEKKRWVENLTATKKSLSTTLLEIHTWATQDAYSEKKKKNNKQI